MKRFKVHMTAVFSLCAALIASPVFAQMSWDGLGERLRMKEQKMEKVFSELHLSDEQRRLLELNKQRHKEQSAALRKELKGQMKLMDEEFLKEPLDLKRIADLHASTKELRGRMMDEKFQSIVEVRKILTHQQFAQFTALIKEYKDKDGDKGPRHDRP